MQEDKICPICGEPTSKYMGNYRKDLLCPAHAKLLKEGKLKQQSNEYFELINNNWESINKNKEKKEIIFQNNNQEELNCLICGKQIDSFHFCPDCYNTFKNKKIVLQIRNLRKSLLLGEEYNGEFICSDGHIVKSQAERNIDEFLFKENVKHGYEVQLPVDENISIKPDFCLFDFRGLNNNNNSTKVFVEYFGIENDERYENQKKFKIDYYKKIKATVICLYPEDNKDIYGALNKKLNFYEIGKTNYEK